MNYDNRKFTPRITKTVLVDEEATRQILAHMCTNRSSLKKAMMYRNLFHASANFH